MDFYEIVEHIENVYDVNLYNYKNHNFIQWVIEKDQDVLNVYSAAPKPIREILFLIAKEYAPRKGILRIEL